VPPPRIVGSAGSVVTPLLAGMSVGCSCVFYAGFFTVDISLLAAYVDFTSLCEFYSHIG